MRATVAGAEVQTRKGQARPHSDICRRASTHLEGSFNQKENCKNAVQHLQSAFERPSGVEVRHVKCQGDAAQQDQDQYEGLKPGMAQHPVQLQPEPVVRAKQPA